MGVVVNHNGERVCSGCGLVLTRSVVRMQWIGDSHKPVNNLAFGRGLGGTLQIKGLYYVLAKGSGNKDLPMRARQISILTEKHEHPKIRTMLNQGHEMLEQLGFGDRKNPVNIQLSNMLGSIIRVVGAYMVLHGDRTPVRSVVKACLFAAFRYVRIGQYPAPQAYGVSWNIVGSVCKLYEAYVHIVKG